jgi:hypothetical protein
VRVRQRKDENPNITLMHVGFIAGTPVFPKIAFSVDLLELFYHIRRRQPSIGVQGFVKAMCAFRQVCVSPKDCVSRPASMWPDPSYAAAHTGTGAGNAGTDASGSTTLDSLRQTLYPLFCVSMHEHAWMAAGYGVWGKETYLERSWSSLDWVAVRDAYALYTRPRH